MTTKAIEPISGRPFIITIVLIGVLGTAFSSILIKLSDAPALVIAAYRKSIAALLLLPLFLGGGAGELRRLDARGRWLLIASGVFLALHLATWISSLKFTSVASSVVFIATSPIFVSIGSYFILRERIGWLAMLGIAIAVAGSVLLVWSDLVTSGTNVWGDVLSLWGAVLVVGYLLIGRYLRQSISVVAYACPVYAVAAIVLLGLVALRGEPLFGHGLRNYLLFLGLAAGPSIVGHTSYNWALKYLPPFKISVAALGEPVLAIGFAALLLREYPGLLSLVGGAIVVWGVYLTLRPARP